MRVEAPARVAVRVLACGNLERCDDGAAIWATAALAYRLGNTATHVEIRRCEQLDIDDVLGADGRPIVIVDTAVGVPAGAVVTVPFDELVVRPAGPTPQSSHALPIDQVLGIARELAGPAVDGVFVGIGGFEFGYGRHVSPAVRANLSAFVDAIENTVEALAVPRRLER